MKRLARGLAQLVLLASGAIATASPPRAPSPDDLPCVSVGEPVTYDVELRFVVTPPHHAHLLRVWVPVPQDDSAQTITGSTFETWPKRVPARLADEPLYGNRFAYFEFAEPRGAQMITHRFRAVVRELRWNLDPAQVEDIEEWPPSFAPFLRKEEQAVVVDGRVRATLQEIGAASLTAPLDLFAAADWIDARLTYDHSTASLQASARWALEQRRGHCSDYHGLCAAFSRALGHPARVAYGIHPFPKNSPSHCKTEVFLPPYGWVSFDVSETQRLCARLAAAPDLEPARRDALIRAARERLRSGFRDATWIAQTRGSDYDLAPPASRRVAVVRTLYAEADGVPLPEPDPGDASRREFAWMTLHRYVADREVAYPFEDWRTLEVPPAPAGDSR